MGCILKGGGGLYNRLVVGAVVLAAGAGSRIGQRPNSLLELGGVPLIRRTLFALSGAGVDEVVVVLGHYADQIGPVVEDFPVTVVINPDPDAGQVSSQRLGLKALNPKIDAVVMALADQPLINSQDIVDVIGAWKKRPEGASVVYPQVNGERGNPLVFSADVRDQIIADNTNTGCRQWQSKHPELVVPFVNDNRRYRVDIDTEQDLQIFEQTTGHKLCWPAPISG